MKTLKTFLSVIFLGIITTITAQIPNSFSYQAAIRGNAKAPKASTIKSEDGLCIYPDKKVYFEERTLLKIPKVQPFLISFSSSSSSSSTQKNLFIKTNKLIIK